MHFTLIINYNYDMYEEGLMNIESANFPQWVIKLDFWLPTKKVKYFKRLLLLYQYGELYNLFIDIVDNMPNLFLHEVDFYSIPSNK